MARFQTVLPSAARGTTTTPASGGGYSTHESSLVIMTVDTTAGAGTSLIVKLQGFDPVSGKWFDVTDGTSVAQCQALTSTQTAVLVVGPGITTKAPANGGTYQSLSTVVPAQLRVVSTVAGANPTFSVGLSFLP